MKSLYRKYRPLKLGDVVGQEQVTSVLSNSLKAGKISHAYLFIGPRGTGKTSVARIFAHEVNGFKYELEDDYVDIIEIDGASNRGIDNIRELREKAAIAPTSGKYKIYIVDEVHMLTKEAFNALLKTLEEPPKHVIFIMATTDAHKVPVTITSRAQTYTFRLADAKTMLDFLKSVAKKEKIKITDEALAVVAKRGGGSFRDCLSLLDQISTLSEKEITEEMVVRAMGLPEDEKIAELLENYSVGDVVKITTVLKDLLATGTKAETIAEEVINSIIDDPKPEWLPLLAKLPEVRAPFAEAKLLVTLCNNIKIEKKVIIEKEIIKDKREVVLKKKQIPDTQASTGFDFAGFMTKMEVTSEVVYKQLARCEHEVKGDTLHLYPKTKIVKNILESKNNKQILINNVEGLKVEVHTPGEHPETAKKDETLNKLSAIMGGEVINDGGDNPF